MTKPSVQYGETRVNNPTGIAKEKSASINMLNGCLMIKLTNFITLNFFFEFFSSM